MSKYSLQKIYIFLFVFFLFASNSLAKEESLLKLEDFINLSRKNDVSVEQILHDRTKTSFLKDLQLPANALVLNIQNEYGFGLEGAENTEAWIFSGSKEFPETGTRVFASHEINDQDDRRENVTRVGIEQSVFKNAFGKQVRRQAAQLDRENRSIYLQSVDAYEDYIATIINEFLDWRLTYLNYLATQDLYSQSYQFQKHLEARRKRSVARKVDVQKVTLESLDYKEGLLALETEMVRQKSEVFKRTDLPKNKLLIPNQVGEFYNLTLDLNEEKSEALKQTRTMEALQELREAGRLQILVKREDLYPDINFLGGYNLDDSNRFGTSTNRQEVFLGFQFNWPIFNRPDRAALKEAKFEHISAELAEKEYRKNLETALIAQIERIRVGRERLDISKQKWDLSQHVVKAEKKRYERGQIDIEILILSHQDLAENRYAYLENHIRLNKEIIEWLRLTDRLVNKDQVQLQN